MTDAQGFSIKRLFFIWLKIGLTSFGGGAITQYLIQENLIYRQKWLTEEEYVRIVAMCQLAPGINIIAYTILIGKRLAGTTGIFVSLLGLIMPSVAITVGITALYASASGFPKVQSVLQTAFAAIFGISLATNWRNAKPIVLQNAKRGTWRLLFTLSIIIGSGILYIFFKIPVVILYLLGGLIGAVTYWHTARKEQRE